MFVCVRDALLASLKSKLSIDFKMISPAESLEALYDMYRDAQNWMQGVGGKERGVY